MLKNKRGQSTLEYIILVTAVIAVLIIFLNPTTGILRNKVNQTYDTVSDGLLDMANRINASH